MKGTRALAFGIALLLTASAQAAVPGELHYQGYLTDAEGGAVHCPDAESCEDVFNVTFRAYDTDTGGDALWEETHAGVSVSHGLFNVRLGSQTPLDPAALGDPTWIGLEINDAGELLPRQRVVSAAFSLRAGQAETADTAAMADDTDRLGGIDAVDYALVADLPGLCVTDEDLAAMDYVNEFGVDEQIAAYLTMGGYVAGAHFSGSFGDLSDLPEDLADGDDDTLSAMSCEAGFVARFDGAAWACSEDLVLTEDDVDAMVDNNGYAAADALALVAWSGSYLDLADTPALAAALTLTEDGEVAFNGAAIVDGAGQWIGDPTGLIGPKGEPGNAGEPGVGIVDAQVDAAGQLVLTLSDGTVYTSPSLMGPEGPPGDDGALAGLTCADGQVVKMVAGAWACAPDTVLDEAQVDAMANDNGYATEADLDDGLSSLAPVAHSGLFEALVEVPAGLADGDDDALGALDCPVGHVARMSETGWACAPKVTGQLPTSAPVDCSPEAVGTMYFDLEAGSLRICDGDSYKKIRFCSEECPLSSAVACGAPIVDDCGESCEGTGTGLDATDCTPPEQLPCGEIPQDDCGNACPTPGTALNTAECADAAEVACGETITDSCGNPCAATGTLCGDVNMACDDGQCRHAESCAELLELDPDKPNGTYTIQPPGSGQVGYVCEMDVMDGGWTKLGGNHNLHGQYFSDTTYHDPPGDMPYTEVLLIHASGNAVAGPSYPGSHPGSTPVVIEIEGAGWHGGTETGGSSCNWSYSEDFGITFDPVDPTNMSFQLGYATTARLRVSTVEGNANCTTSDNNGPAYYDVYVR